MKNLVVYVSILFFLLLSTSCSIAPLKTPKTARALGKGHWEMDLGALPSSFSAYRGFSENLDIGLTLEEQLGVVVELSGKYAFLNREEGSSLAIFGGVFSGSALYGDNRGFRVGGLWSYKRKWWELYLVSTYNSGRWKAGKPLDADEKDDLLIDFFYDYEGRRNYSYIQSSLGSNFWFTKKFALSINTTFLFNFESDGSDGDSRSSNPLIGLALIWRL